MYCMCVYLNHVAFREAHSNNITCKYNSRLKKEKEREREKNRKSN